MRKLICDEIKIRNPDLLLKPLKVSIPYIENLDLDAIKAAINKTIDNTKWPDFIKNWHKGRATISMTTQPTIGDIMCNVTAPWRPTKCNCHEISKKLANHENSNILCVNKIDGHILMTGRDYKGPRSEVLNTAANNIPRQTAWDAKKAIENIRKL